MHRVLEVALAHEVRQHEHVVGHLGGQLEGPSRDIVGAANLEAIHVAFRVGAEGHDVQVLAASWRLEVLSFGGGELQTPDLPAFALLSGPAHLALGMVPVSAGGLRREGGQRQHVSTGLALLLTGSVGRGATRSTGGH
jgi:hypothetical protein